MGACDPLFAPRPLGPLLDVARAAGGELAQLVQAGALPHDVSSALIDELSEPTILVLEDVSYLSFDPRWRPTLPGRVRSDFRMTDFLTFAGVDPVSRGQ